MSPAARNAPLIVMTSLISPAGRRVKNDDARRQPWYMKADFETSRFGVRGTTRGDDIGQRSFATTSKRPYLIVVTEMGAHRQQDGGEVDVEPDEVSDTTSQQVAGSLRAPKLGSVSRAERGDGVRVERDNEGGGDGGAERGSSRRSSSRRRTAGGAAGCGGS